MGCASEGRVQSLIMTHNRGGYLCVNEWTLEVAISLAVLLVLHLLAGDVDEGVVWYLLLGGPGGG